MRRVILAAAIALGALACAPPAQACPMCKYANESCDNDAVRNARPRAYMYSILFMLAVPATLFTGYGFGFYRLHKQQQLGETDGELE
jgi:hypothetical protein